MNSLKLLAATLVVAVFVAACQPQAANTATTSTSPSATTSAAATTPSPAVAYPAYPTASASSSTTSAATPAAASAATPAATMAPAAGTPAASTTMAAGPVSLKVATDPKLGSLLTDGKGMTLYMYTKDEANTSNCYDQCAVAWPPLLTDGTAPTTASGIAGQFGTTTRKDGSKQVTYNTMPLYYWAKDTKAGDTTGQNVGGVWFVVPPTTAGFPTVKTATAADKALGVILTDLKGMTLYIYTKDTPNTSVCYDQCAVNWPPLTVASGDPVLAGGLEGKIATTTRTDGKKQVTYNGQPLYYFAKDTKAGDTTGQNVGGVWFVVAPKAQ
ncbi:MAG: hypothetical protein ACYC3S_12690 [Chloroflexota bacterium]